MLNIGGTHSAVMWAGLIVDVPKASQFGILMEQSSAIWLSQILPEYIDVQYPTSRYGTDIILTNKNTGVRVSVEVKSARRNADGKYRATLFKLGHADAKRHSDIVIFFCVVPGTQLAIPFIIPIRDIDTNSICVTSNPLKYRGTLAKYRFNIDILRDMLEYDHELP